MVTEPEYKRFMVFRCNTYYPEGGLSDVDESFDTLEEAIKFCKERYYDFRYIFDRIEGKIVEVAS